MGAACREPAGRTGYMGRTGRPRIRLLADESFLPDRRARMRAAGEVVYFFLSESSVHRYERHRNDRDDDSDIGVKDGRDKVVSLLESPIEDRLSVTDNRLDPTANLECPIRIVGVLDMKGNPRVVLEVAVLLPVSSVRKAGSFPIPCKPHHAALRGSIRAKGGEMSEERSLKQVSMARRKLCTRHLRNSRTRPRPAEPGRSAARTPGRCWRRRATHCQW
jgi:hypothetical protein